MTTATLTPAPPVTDRPSPAWHFTIASPFLLRCDLCEWGEWFPSGTMASSLALEMVSHHRFICPEIPR